MIIALILVGTKPSTVKVALSCQHNNQGNKLGFVRQNGAIAANHYTYLYHKLRLKAQKLAGV